MKKLFLFAAFLPFAFVSCTTDDSDTEALTEQNTVKQSIQTGSYNRDANWTPENNGNSYDNAGKIYYQVLDTYYQGNNAGKTQQQIVASIENIANANADFVAIKNSNYTAVSLTKVQWIITASNSFDATASAAALSAEAKTRLGSFKATVDTMISENKSVEDVHDYIIPFESSIISATNLSATDKRAILTTTSIARNSNYLRKKDRNKTRETYGNGITASVEGNIDSMARAITTSAMTAAIINE